MESLQKKLQSQSGASILMALLLLLICMMVAATILAAAASNAGKARSNRVEQQKYLTLSSAIRLVAEQLQEAKYWGRYEIYEWTVATTDLFTNPDGSVSTVSSESKYFRCVQVEGRYGRADTNNPSVPMDPPDPSKDLTEQVPLGKGLDEMFRRRFIDRGGTVSGYTPLEDAKVENETVHMLTVTLPAGVLENSIEGLEVYRVPRVVTVKVTLDHNTKHMLLTAWLGEDSVPPADLSDTMIAELVAKGTSVPSLDYNPGSRMIGELPIPTDESEPGKVMTVTVDRNGEVVYAGGAPMEWELNWIKKGGA